MRLLIIGAAGFIGSHLVRFVCAQGHEVVAICRAGNILGFTGTTIRWELGQPVPPAALKGIDCAIHLAHDFNSSDGAALTLESTIACIKQLREAGVKRQIFFSSYSAGPHSASLYGRTKFSIEFVVKEFTDVVIVRPGLVIGNGGLYGRIRKFSQRLPVIPLPDGGRGQLPVISVESLCRETLALASKATPIREVNLFESRMRSLRQLVLDAAGEGGRHPLILPMPSKLIFAGLWLANQLRLPLPVNSENLQGFLANQHARHVATLTVEKK